MTCLAKPVHCETCLGWQWGHTGYVPADGSGRNGVLIILEAAGADEAAAGIPTCGRAGFFLWNTLNRVGLEREDFRIHNVLSCQPLGNKLAKMPYEEEVIAHCSPLLDATIADMQERCKANGKHFTILTLGRIAFKRIMGLREKDPIMRADYLNYPFHNEKYDCFVLAGDHPSYLMRGNSHLIPCLQYGASRAIEIAEKGLKFHEPTYLCDPNPGTFGQWVRDYLKLEGEGVYLSFDIETPHKQGKDEEEVAREDDDDYTILRCSFSYRPGEAVSVPWRAEYLPYLEQLFSHNSSKLAHNMNYDVPRITAQMPINGPILDNMLAWHVLNSSLPKGLGFITPFYAKDMPMWKHLSDKEPAAYNCQDADATLRDFLGIKKDLEKNGLKNVFERHIVKLNEVLSYMSSKGVLRDEVMRKEAEERLSKLLDEVETKMKAVVPKEARRLSPKNGYKKTPSNLDGLVQATFRTVVKRCDRCGCTSPTKTHFKARKRAQNPCEGATSTEAVEEVIRWAKPLEFKVSKVGLTNYQKALKHQAIIDRKKSTTTFDVTAIQRLMRKYPQDPLYPLILDQRELVKLLGTYIGETQPDGRVRGGMNVGRDGRVHTTFSHNPSTLRLASQQPNLQNLPRPKGDDELATIIRNLIIADSGKGGIFTARDYSGIEAVLVGYFAASPRYIRLAKIDVHSFYTAYALNQLDGRVSSMDLPDFNWPDDKLIPHLAAIKNEFKQDRNELYKHLVHGANFFQGPKGAAEKIYRETGIEFPVKKVATVMGIYFELFPEISKWHQSVWLQADKDGFIRNPFGYIHRFNRIFHYTKENGKWKREPGDDANKAVAFLPQSTAAGIIKEAMLRLYFNRFEEAGQYLRLQIHDEIFCEVPEDLKYKVDEVLKEEMERFIPEMRLPASYRMGDYLSIDTEGKMGYRWGSMS